MILKTARLCLILWMTVFFSGCSTVLTYTAPLKSELADGERKTGSFIRYEYFCSGFSNKMCLEKRPLCRESVIKMRHAQKELRCFTCSVIELAIFGLGLVDMLWARAIVEDSRKSEILAEYDTGKPVACGDIQPAAGETVYIENIDNGIHEQAVTDAAGMIDFHEVLHHLVSESIRLELRLKADESVEFEYVYVADSPE